MAQKSKRHGPQRMKPVGKHSIRWCIPNQESGDQYVFYVKYNVENAGRSSCLAFKQVNKAEQTKIAHHQHEQLSQRAQQAWSRVLGTNPLQWRIVNLVQDVHKQYVDGEGEETPRGERGAGERQQQISWRQLGEPHQEVEGRRHVFDAGLVFVGPSVGTVVRRVDQGCGHQRGTQRGRCKNMKIITSNLLLNSWKRDVSMSFCDIFVIWLVFDGLCRECLNSQISYWNTKREKKYWPCRLFH